MQEALDSLFSMIHTCNPSTLRVEAGASTVPPLFHSEFNTSLRCMGFCLKRKRNEFPAWLQYRLSIISADIAPISFNCELDIAQSPLGMESQERGVQTANLIDLCARPVS